MSSGEEEEEVCCRCDPFTVSGFGSLLTRSSLPALPLLQQQSHANLPNLTRLLWIVLSLGLNSANCRGQLARKPSATATSSTGLEEDEDGEGSGEEAE